MNPLSKTALPDLLLREVRGGNTGLLAHAAITGVDAVVNDADGDFGEFDHLTPTAWGSTREGASAVGTVGTGVNHFFGGNFPMPDKRLGTFLARRLGFRRRRGRVGLDPIGRFGEECAGSRLVSFETGDFLLPLHDLLEQQSNHLGLLLHNRHEFLSGFVGVSSHLGRIRTDKAEDSHNPELLPSGHFRRILGCGARVRA